MIACSVMSRVAPAVRCLVGVSLLSGCGVFRHVNVEPLATTSQRPSNVGAFVAVSDGDQPLTELTPSNFRVYENEQLVPPEQTELTLLDTNLVAANQALLLIDMSTAQAPVQRSVVAKAAKNFVQKLTPHQAVMVFAFDGGPNLVPIARLPRGTQPVTMAALESFTPRDPSRNLNGAVIAALDKLDAALAQSGKPVRVGTLVVFASGPDIAGRVDGDKAHDAVWQSPHDVIGIGVGLGEQADAIESLSRRGLIRAQAADTLPIAFEEAADKALEELQKHYLVSYCSPARAGSRRLRLEVIFTNKQGEEHDGDFEVDFSAKGFGPGCNPRVTPRFSFTPKPVAPADGERAADPANDAEPSKGKPTDSTDQDHGNDAPVAPPDQSGYAK
jgi:hypothetical protein